MKRLREPNVHVYAYKGRWRWVLTDKISNQVLELGDEKSKSCAQNKAYEKRREYLAA